MNPPRATPSLRAWRALTRTLTLPLLGWLWWRGRREPAYRERLGERLGFIPIEPTHFGCLWLHAASVGEVQAARPVIEKLLQEWPAHALVVTTQTPTGAKALHGAWGDRITHRYAPMDTPGAVARFLDRLRPQALVLIERELWPQWLFACAERALPVALINARLTESSARGYQRWGSVMRHAWPTLQVASADEQTARLFAALGVPTAQVRVAGNLKFDVAPAPVAAPLAPALAGRRLVVAGSTHEGDEAAWLDAWTGLAARHPDALLVLVPRHPQRFDAVSQSLRARGWTHARRSRGEWPGTDDRVFLVDAMGELMHWYRHAALCFVGGTLAPVGGHNPLEPLSLGQPVLFGPHTQNAPALFDEALQAGAAVRVADAQGLRDAADQALTDPAAWAARSVAARALMDRHRGAIDRTWPTLQAALGPVKPDRLGLVWVRAHPDGCTVWHDPTRGPEPGVDHFTPAAGAVRLATGSGRGQAALVTHAQGTQVLRHYRRGGLVARISDDRFLREPVQRSRAMQEFALLRLMQSWDLPVPVPVAALHRPRGLTYSADIAVGLIAQTRNLVQCLRESRPEPAAWAALGRAIRRLHDRQVFHADLNAHNLLLDAAGAAWVIDFDKCDVRPGDRWKRDNLARLLRSLRKESGREPSFHWHEDDWPLLTSAYGHPPHLSRLP
ncbi:3-deoxy-D-manno-octulosonic acid kinase [Hydrogenophaga sp. XSHU_21]